MMCVHSKEQLKAAMEKKKECSARAMAIVERLIELGVDELWMLENVRTRFLIKDLGFLWIRVLMVSDMCWSL